VPVLPVLGDPPSFRAQTYTRDDLWSPPKSDAEFAAFAVKLVQRYGPNGALWAAHPEVPALPIRSWQIWNEPNLLMFWNTGPDPAAYTALLRAAHDAIHAADPGAEVVAAGLPDSRAGIPELSFISEMFAAGAKGSFETIAVHPYAPTAAGSVDLVARTRALLTAERDASPIWVTEVGWPTGGPLSPYTVTEAQQAVEVRSVIATLGARRAELGVRGVVIFRSRDAVSTFDAWPMHAGLIRADGSAKPAFAAFRDAVAALDAAVAAAPAADGDQPGTASQRTASGSKPGSGRGVAISGGDMSRYGFPRVHLRCLEGFCGGPVRAGRPRSVCSGHRTYVLTAGAKVILRVHLKGTRRQLQRCKHILVTAESGAGDPPAAAFLPKKAVRYAP
jgi:hypothetical protein